MLDDSMINGAVARARRRGKRLGWPKKIVRAAKIAHLRSQRHSWREITEETGMSKRIAQRPVSSLPQNIRISFAEVSIRNCLISGPLIDQWVVYGQPLDSGSARRHQL
jgi:hypothetical protein